MRHIPVLALLMHATCALAGPGIDPARWSAPARDGCINLATEPTPAIRFVSRNTDHVVTPWQIGTEPFDFSFGVEIASGRRRPWRWPGVAVAVLSGKPGELKESDLVLSMGVHLQGVIADARRGGFFDLYEQRPRAWRWRGKGLAPRYTLNMSGGGGHNYSIKWPVKRLDGIRLYLRIKRSADNEILFSVYHRDGGNTPWWTGRWTLSEKMAGVPLTYVAVKTFVHHGDPGKPVKDADLLTGKIFDLRGGPAAQKPFAPFDELPAVMPELADTAGFPHPCLWYDREGLADLRKKFNEPLFADYRKLILTRADRPMAENGKIGTPSHASIINTYLWAYVLSEKPAYRKKLMAAVDALLIGTDALPEKEHGSPGKKHLVITIDEFMCHNGEAIATVYDSLFHELTPEQRTRMFRYLKRHLFYYRERIRENDWWYRNNPSNTIAVGSGCNGIVALALRPLVPAWKDAVDTAVKTIREKYVAMAADGGCIEGALYWDYGFTNQVMFGNALKNALGDDRGMLTAGHLKNVPAFVETQLGGDGRFFPFNDSQPWLTGMAICADFGSRLNNQLLRWMADKTAAEAAAETTPVFTRAHFYALAFRARDRKPVTAFPGVPTLAYLEKLHWGVLRSEGDVFKPRLVMGIKGRDGKTTHHAQEDLGGYALQARGESFLIDPGYYQGKAAAHSVPLIGGTGPEKKAVARISDAWERGAIRTMTVDATAAYKAAGAQRVRRIFLLIGAKAAIVVDDLVAEQPVTAQYQCGFPTRVSEDGTAATVTGVNTRLTIRPRGRDLSLKCEGPVDFGRSWVFAETGVKWYRVRGEYTADADRPLVTVFQPLKRGAPAEACTVAYSDGRIEIRMAGKPAAALIRTDDGWQVAGKI